MDDLSTSRLHEAWQWIQLGRHEHALNQLTVLLAGDPDNADAWWLLAIASGDDDTRRRALRNVLRLRPDDQPALRMSASLGARPATQEIRPITFAPLPARVSGQAPPWFHHAAIQPYLPPVAPPLQRRRPLRRTAQRPRWIMMALVSAATAGMIGCGLLFCALAVTGLTFNSRWLGTLNPVATVAARPNVTSIWLRSGLRYNQWLDGRLDVPGQLDGYNFSGHHGERIAVQVNPLDAMTLVPVLGLYGPGHTLLAGSMTPDPDTALRLALELPDDGDFVLVVGGQNATIGPYRLMLRHLE